MRSKRPSPKLNKLEHVAKAMGMSIPGVHHELKKIINKMIDRLKPSYFADGLGVFEIVLDLSVIRGVKNNPGEIFNKLNPVNKKLCVIQAKRRAPHLVKHSGDFEDLLGG